MDAKTAMRLMIDNSGLSDQELSQRMGKGRNYVYSMRKQGSMPKVDTFARFAHECGYRLMLEREDGEQIELCSRDDAVEYGRSAIVNGALLTDKSANEFSADPGTEYRHHSAREATEEEAKEVRKVVEQLENDPEAMERHRADNAKRLARERSARAARKEREEAFFKRPAGGDSGESQGT